jgi:hypothetical protein
MLASCPFDRKIADAHYNLALSHMMLVAQQQQQQQQQQAPDADDTNAPPSSSHVTGCFEGTP